MKTQPKFDQRQLEAVLLAKNYQKYPREVVAALAARYRPDLKRWAAYFRYRRPSIPARDYEAVALGSIPSAARTYDSSKGACFGTHLYNWAKWACLRYANENGDYLKVFGPRKRRDDQDEEKDKIPAVFAIPWDDLTDRDLAYAAETDENPRREREQKEARKTIQQFREFLNELLEVRGLQENQNRLTVPQKRAALALEYMSFFLEHADDPSMGRFMKKDFCASKGKKGRETLDNALDYVLNQFSRNSKYSIHSQTSKDSTN